MGAGRQRKLFRRGKQAPAEGEGLGREPSRLTFGEPESLAYKRAKEAELERERRDTSDRRRRERHREERLRRVEVEVPVPHEVVRALREELTRSDVGLPPHRDRIEVHALDELAERYPSVPRQYVHDVFDQARSAGLLRYRGRTWSWEAGEASGQREAALASIAVAVAAHAVVLRPQRERSLLGAGTLVGVAGELGIMTTREVWDCLRSTGRPLEVHVARGRSVAVDLELLDVAILGEGLVPLTDVGPDLALLRLPGMLRRPLLGSEKVPYTFDEDPGLPLGADVVHGIASSPLSAQPRLLPATVGSRRRTALRPWRAGAAIEIEHVDGTVAPPVAACLPGAGLWASALDATGGMLGRPSLEGVVLSVRDDGAVRCHGRASLDDLVRQVRPVKS